MESWGAKGKRTKCTNTKSLYDDLPNELKRKILRKLPSEDLSSAMCVSNTWRKLILHNCVPKPCFPLPFLGLLLRVNTNSERSYGTRLGWLAMFIDALGYPPFVGLENLVKWCSRMMNCRVTPKKLLDSCNGLILFCHKDGKVEGLIPEKYYYYVMNPITKQCVAVLKPGLNIAQFMYAALAYDPLESYYFRIVRFQGCGSLNVFSSETCCWTNLSFELPQEVARAKWERKSIYLKGAIYRLSNSDHLIKFFVDPKEKLENHAVAIKLPVPTCSFYKCDKDIAIRDKKVIFALSAGTCFTIWELVEHSDEDNRVECAYDWCQTHKIEGWCMWDLNRNGKLLAMHPYSAMALFRNQSYIEYLLYHDLGFRTLGFNGAFHRYITDLGFPLLACSIPFACCLDKKDPKTFQRLLLPENCRGFGVYPAVRRV